LTVVVSKRQSKDRSLGEAIGAGVHGLRAKLGLTQDELARRLRDAGGDWDQAAVARLEAGHREVRLEQVLLLAAVLEAPAHALIAADDDDWILMSARARWRAQAIRAGLEGINLSDLAPGNFDEPSIRSVTSSLAARSELLAIAARVWPKATRAQAHDAVEAVGDAERKAGRRLGVHPVAVSAAAFRRWGQSFADRRDELAAELAESARDRRSLQALRGHVTRQLLAELAPILEQEADQ
jgi:transcriptional regulator with XRE-family HTH domain